MAEGKACLSIILFRATHEFIPSASTILFYLGKCMQCLMEHNHFFFHIHVLLMHVPSWLFWAAEECEKQFVVGITGGLQAFALFFPCWKSFNLQDLQERTIGWGIEG